MRVRSPFFSSDRTIREVCMMSTFERRASITCVTCGFLLESQRSAARVMNCAWVRPNAWSPAFRCRCHSMKADHSSWDGRSSRVGRNSLSVFISMLIIYMLIYFVKGLFQAPITRLFFYPPKRRRDILLVSSIRSNHDTNTCKAFHPKNLTHKKMTSCGMKEGGRIFSAGGRLDLPK